MYYNNPFIIALLLLYKAGNWSLEILGDYPKVKKLPVKGPVFELKVICHPFPDSDK